MLAFGAYEPDTALTNPGASRAIRNVIPMKDNEVGIAYRPMPNFVTVPGAAALPDVPQGAISIVNPSNGNYEVYACTSTNIYRLQADYTWTSIGSGYNLPAEDTWAVIQFGGLLIFSNTFDGMLQYNVVTPGAITLIPGAPKARFLFEAFDCVFALDCDGENRLMRNSGINNPLQWTPGQNGANYQPMPDGQELVAGGKINDGTAIVLQRNSIRILSRTGTRQIYSMDSLAQNVGCVTARSLVNSGSSLYFLSTDGFWAVNSAGLRAIGSERVNRTFYGLVNESLLYRTQGAYDPVNNLVIWMYQGAGDAAGTMDAGFAFAESSNAWCEFVPAVALGAIYQFATPGYGLDSIDGFGDLDHLPFSLDSRFWLGGEPRLAGIGADGKVGYFDGTNAAAYLETSASYGQLSRLVNFAVPVTDAANLNISLSVGDNLLSLNTGAPVNTTNQRAAMRGRGKAIRFNNEIPAATVWSFFRGVDFVEGAEGGRR